MNTRVNTGTLIPVLSIMLGGASATAAEPLTYEALLRRVPEASPDVRQAQARIAAAEGELSRVWSAWRPQVSLSGQLQYSTQEVELDFGQIVGGLATGFGVDPSTLDLPPPTVIQPHWSVAGVATVRQLLFDPSAWKGPSIARAALQSQTLAAEATADELRFAAAQLYAGLQTVEALEAAALRALEVANKRTADAEVRVEAGLATPIEVTRARTRAAEARSQLASILAQRKNLQADLQVVIGAEAPVEVVSAPLPAQLGRAGEGAESRRDVAALKAALRAADADESRTAWLWMPSLFFEAQGTATNVGGFAGNNFFGTATLGLAFPLYDGGSRYAQRDIAQAKVEQTRAQLDATRIRAESLITKAAARLEEARSRLELARAQLELADQAVAQVDQLRQSGLATSLDLDSADVQRFAADRQLAERDLDVALARLRLHHARGGHLE